MEKKIIIKIKDRNAAGMGNRVVLSMRKIVTLFCCFFFGGNVLAANGNQPPIAEDINPDPHIVEVNITASVIEKEILPGVLTTVWAYNGTVPGPTIDVNLGDTVVVNFKNDLPEPTTLHWHGMDVPANMDGSHIAQGLVPSGGTFRYEFKALNAATYWYHPHIHSNEQVEMGLYGAFIIRDPIEDARINVPRENEFILFVDDILLDDSGQIANFATDSSYPMDPLERAEELLNARPGNYFLTNGELLPEIDVIPGEPVRLRIINASNGRFMRLSVPNEMFYYIASDQGLFQSPPYLPIMPLNMGDINEVLPIPFSMSGVLLTPSERAEVVFVPNGLWWTNRYLKWYDIKMGRAEAFYREDGTIGHRVAADDGERPAHKLVRFKHLFGLGSGWRPELPMRTEKLERIDTKGADVLPVFFGHHPVSDDGSIDFFAAVTQPESLTADLNRLTHLAKNIFHVGPVEGFVDPANYVPVGFKDVTEQTALHAEVGDVKIFEVVNFTEMDHTFHTHGFPFQIISETKVDLDKEYSIGRALTFPNPVLFNKDSVKVPGRIGAYGRSWTRIRLAVQFDDSARPVELQRSPDELVAFGKVPENSTSDPKLGKSGGWVLHCHFLEHGASGMMSYLSLTLPE